MGRLDEPGAVVSVHGEARHRTGFTLSGRVALAPSRGRHLAALDTRIAAGPGFRTRLRSRVTFGLAVRAGLLVHRYVVDERVGHVFDLAVAASTDLTIQLAGRLDLVLDLTGGLVPRPTRHVYRSDVDWERDRGWVSGAIGLRYTWGRDRRKLEAPRGAEGS